MRYPASEKAEIIQLVEQSHLPAKRTLDKLGIPRATFYRWYDRYREGGPEALDDRRSRPDRVWNRIPDNVRRQIIGLALDLPELSPRSRRRTSSGTRPPPSTNSGRRTSPTSRSPVGDGTISRPCSMTSRATSWPGSSVPRCASMTLLQPSTWRCLASPSRTGQGFSQTMARLTLPAIWPSGSIGACARGAVSSPNSGKDRTLAPDSEE